VKKTKSTTRGNKYKLQKSSGYYNIRKYLFSSRVVNMWNSLPNDVVEADTINTFKNRLDKYWSNQDVLFNFNADLIETRSLPIGTYQFACGQMGYLRPSEHIGLDGF